MLHSVLSTERPLISRPSLAPMEMLLGGFSEGVGIERRGPEESELMEDIEAGGSPSLPHDEEATAAAAGIMASSQPVSSKHSTRAFAQQNSTLSQEENYGHFSDQEERLHVLSLDAHPPAAANCVQSFTAGDGSGDDGGPSCDVDNRTGFFTNWQSGGRARYRERSFNRDDSNINDRITTENVLSNARHRLKSIEQLSRTSILRAQQDIVTRHSMSICQPDEPLQNHHADDVPGRNNAVGDEPFIADGASWCDDRLEDKKDVQQHAEMDTEIEHQAPRSRPKVMADKPIARQEMMSKLKRSSSSFRRVSKSVSR